MKTVQELIEKVDELEKLFDNQKTSNLGINSKLDRISEQMLINYEKFKAHAEEEMTVYDEVISSMTQLTDTMKDLINKTDANTRYVDSKKYNEEMEKRVANHISELERPKKEIIHKFKMAAITAAATALVGGTMVVMKFLYELSQLLKG